MTSITRQQTAIREIPTLFSPEECTFLIQWSEQQGYANHQPNADQPPGYAFCESTAPLPEFVAERLRSGLRPPNGGVPPDPSSHPAMFFRFDGRQRLLPTRPEGEDGGERLCVQIYLNEDYAGGETVCYPTEGPTTITPRQGLTALFPAFLTSEELPVRHGRKYILRVTIISP